MRISGVVTFVVYRSTFKFNIFGPGLVAEDGVDNTLSGLRRLSLCTNRGPCRLRVLTTQSAPRMIVPLHQFVTTLALRLGAEMVEH